MSPRLSLVALTALTGACTTTLSADAPPPADASTLRVQDSPDQVLNGTAGEALGRCTAPAGDLDDDGYAEVLIATDSEVRLHYGSSSGLQRPADQTWAVDSPSCPVVADVDGDELDDLLLIDADGVVSIYLSTSRGWPADRTSRNSGFFDGTDFDFRAIGDIDGDGDEEIQDAAGEVWLGGPGGLSATRPGPSGGAFADFTGDGLIDRVVVQEGDVCGDGALATATEDLVLFRGTTEGLSSEGVVSLTGSCTEFETRVQVELLSDLTPVGDVTGDGRQDLYVTAGTLDVSEEEAALQQIVSRIYPGRLGGPGGTPLSMPLAPVEPGAARVSAGGDHDCDGLGEIIYFDTVANDCVIFDADATTGLDPEPQSLSPSTAPGSACAGVGDVNGDGADDIVWGDVTAGGGDGVVSLSTGVGEDCPVDRDRDRFLSDVDCDDADPQTYPGATEVVGDGVDQDCDGGDTCYQDIDGDGYRSDETIPSTDLDCTDAGEAGASGPPIDCDDRNPAVSPAEEEGVADGIDQDCDGQELCYADADDDGWRTEETVVSEDSDCDDPGEAISTVPVGDCDDQDDTINRGMVDTPADGIDSNCDGVEICYVDADEDGYRGTTSLESADGDCDDPGEALASAPLDCDDSNAATNAGAEDIPDDGIDQDCDGSDAPREGCGCATGATSTPGSLLGGAVLLLAALGRRRRRR